MTIRLHLLPASLVLLTTACTVTLPAVRSDLPTAVDDGVRPVMVSAQAGKNPIIQSFTANPTNVAPKGQAITFQVVAYDPNKEPLQFNWAATGGTLSATAGQVTSWTAPDAPGVHTVSVTITNGRGGVVVGHQNLTVQADGTTQLQVVPTPPPPPSVAPSMAPSPSPSPVASPSPSPSPTPSPMYSIVPCPVSTGITPIPPGFILTYKPGQRVDPLKLTGYTIKDADVRLSSPDPASRTNDIKLRIHSASNTTYCVSTAAVMGTSTNWGGGSYGTAYNGEYHVGDASMGLGPRPGLYAISFYQPCNARSSDVKVELDDGVGLIFVTIPAVPIARANWHITGNVHEALKALDGTIYVFKYDGKGLDLGTFELP